VHNSKFSEIVRNPARKIGKTAIFDKIHKKRKIVTVFLFYVTISLSESRVPIRHAGFDFLLLKGKI
jgi:hypothetical protein